MWKRHRKQIEEGLPSEAGWGGEGAVVVEECGGVEEPEGGKGYEKRVRSRKREKKNRFVV
jgi:hypothetical protein